MLRFSELLRIVGKRNKDNCILLFTDVKTVTVKKLGSKITLLQEKAKNPIKKTILANGRS